MNTDEVDSRQCPSSVIFFWHPPGWASTPQPVHAFTYTWMLVIFGYFGQASLSNTNQQRLNFISVKAHPLSSSPFPPRPTASLVDPGESLPGYSLAPCSTDPHVIIDPSTAPQLLESVPPHSSCLTRRKGSSTSHTRGRNQVGSLPCTRKAGCRYLSQ